MVNTRITQALLIISILTIVATSTSSSTSRTPLVNPTWPTDYPTPTTLGIKYQNATLDQQFNCTKREYYREDLNFNLASRADCGTNFSLDLYGWGVRVGFYSTWFASLLANIAEPKEIVSAIDANSIFLFALEVSALKATFHDGSLMKTDALILWLIGTGTAVGSLSLFGRRTRFWYRESEMDEFGGPGTYVRLLLCFLLNLYGLWFWYYPSKLGFLPAGRCDPRCWASWIFTVPIGSGVRWLFFTFALIWELYWAALLSLSFAYYSQRRRTKRRNGDDTLSRIWSRISSRPPRQERLNEPKWRRSILPVINFLWYILMIVLIEVTLHQNHALSTLYAAPASSSPSQLIPALVGMTTLIRLLWKCSPSWLKDLNPFTTHEARHETKHERAHEEDRAPSNSHLLGEMTIDERGERTTTSK